LSALLSTSATPLWRDTITGTSDAMASRGEMPNGSETDGITYRSAIAYMRSTSAPWRKPVNRTFFASPMEAVSSIIRGSMSPLPLITKRTFGSTATRARPREMNHLERPAQEEHERIPMVRSTPTSTCSRVTALWTTRSLGQAR
jgi:hypothetical protein